jgi:LPS-assembly lipoprotein
MHRATAPACHWVPAFAGTTVIAVIAAMTVACGFHLRGTGGGAALPASLAAVRVISATQLANDPFTVAVRAALTQAGASVVDTPEAPAVVLLGEQTETRVASVSTATAKASGYLMAYSVSFKFDGPRPMAAQTIRLQRSYTFDPTQVLAREQQEQELLRDMRRDAAQQIVRRLARAAAPPEKQSGQ